MTNNVITEIQEDLNRARMAQFFSKHGKSLVALVVVTILAISAYEAYKFYDLRNRMQAGDKLYEVAADFKNPDNIKKLKEVAKTASYTEIALLNEANYYNSQLNVARAKKAYEKLAEIKNANPAFKQIAQLNLVSIKVNEDPNDKSVEAELKKLSASDAIFRFTALEMLGSYYKKQGKTEEAKAAYKEIADDKKAPASLSGRAKALINSF